MVFHVSEGNLWRNHLESSLKKSLKELLKVSLEEFLRMENGMEELRNLLMKSLEKVL